MLHHFLDINPLLILFLLLLIPFVASLFIAPKMIRVLKAMKAGQPIREAQKGVLAPAHQSKVGTPTMGGIMIIGLILLSIVLICDLTDIKVLCVIGVILITAGLGFMDDFAKIRKHSSDGVSGRIKLLIQGIAATVVSLILYKYCPECRSIIIPFAGTLDIGLLFIPLGIVTIIGSSNAVNLTDGLDGLASGCMAIVAFFFIAITQTMQLDFILIASASACLGFLWFNIHPAKVFMGDTGSLALGGMLGSIAVCSGSALILVIIGGIFVVEAISVMLQVAYFKITRRKFGEGRRLFRMAPIHHHFEKLGWSEMQVCVRFWIITFFLGIIGIASKFIILFNIA